MARAFLLVMDSVGIGGGPDAGDYFNGNIPDTGANTLGHIAQACAAGHADNARSGPLYLPNLNGPGLWHAMVLASGKTDLPTGPYGAATERSRGKDTPSGHWELAGVPVPWDWHYFPNTNPAFPEAIVKIVCEAAGVGGILGNCHASGTQMIADHGTAHITTGWPICYTSADSVFQIAAHEEHFGLARLLDLCKAVAPMLHEMRVGRVIARPFIGSTGTFERTANRHDYAIMPPAPVLSNWVQDAGHRVYGLGKVGDIFSMQGFDEVHRGTDTELMTHLADLIGTAVDGSLTFANFVEFDSLYGHRRDVAGYARHLEWFDAALGQILPRLRKGDMLMVTADHGNDPTWVGTDHTRERVPVLIAGDTIEDIGLIGFTDVANLVARHLGVTPLC
jgi:phosphopentomutase